MVAAGSAVSSRGAMTEPQTKALKLAVVCAVCLGAITGVVLLIQWLA